MQRRRDGEYRLREYDPATVHRLAVELLQAFAKDPGAAQIADIEDYLPDVRWLAPGDSERDDLVDAIYDACEHAVVTVPLEGATGLPQALLGIITGLAAEYQNLVNMTDDLLPEEQRAELGSHAIAVLQELPTAINEALGGSGEDKALTEARDLARALYRSGAHVPIDDRLTGENLPDWIHETP